MVKYILFCSFVITFITSYSQDEITTSRAEICGCINQDQEKISERCEIIRAAWLKKYEEADIESKQEMENTFQGCKDDMILSLTDEQICYCGDIYGQIYQFKVTGEGSDIFDKFEEDNKIAVDSCRGLLEQVDAKSWHLFFKRAVNCENLNVFFDNPKHYFYQQIQSITKTESRDTLAHKQIPVSIHKSLNEISDTEICECVQAKNNMTKEFSNANGDQNKEEEITKKYSAIKKKCENLSNGLTEEDYKLLVEKAKNCPN